MNTSVLSLLRIEAPYFVAGAEVSGELVVRAAPILRYMEGWTVFKAMAYATSKGWVATWLKA